MLAECAKYEYNNMSLSIVRQIGQKVVFRNQD